MTAFISRDLSSTSEFRRVLAAAGWQVSGSSLLLLSALPISAIPAADWIFFSSQHAVSFFFQYVEVEGLVVPAVRWAALGAATAQTLLGYTEAVDFCGSGDPASTAPAFRRVAAGRTVLFPGARHSQQSVQRLLSDVLTGIHLPVYDNCAVADPALRTERVLVFTSPMNAGAYLNRHALQPEQRVVAIGATTAAALQALGVRSVTTAAEPTETALAEAVLALVG